MYEVLSILFVNASLLFALSILLLGFKNLYGTRWSAQSDAFFVCTFLVVWLGLTQAYHTSSPLTSLANTVLLSLSLIALQEFFREYTLVGILFYASNILLCIVGALWGFVFLISLDISTPTRFLMMVTLPLLFVTLPFGFLQMIEQYDVLCRKNWKRPRGLRHANPLVRKPMVSLHVPTYAEPPEVVIATLDSIARLDYKNYEVILIDNNTKDEALWRPLEEHCKMLGRKFRFFHVDNLEGAKAGALNFALSKTSKKAEIIGVIDADYQPHANFIKDLVSHFEDPRVGFVQTPHDYREWENNLYLRMCYWEYKAFFHTILVALNERDAALTIGTMCLLRKKALLETGGWATWCVTEDSELSIRIHNAGYSSVYIPNSYGKGLIPATFADYSKQRYRWIAGPVQELKYHLSLFLGLSKKPLRLNGLQRLHHFNHGFGSWMFSLNIPLIVLSLALALSMVAHKEIIPVPLPLWVAVTALFISSIFLHWLQYRVILNTSVKEMFLGLLAHKALSHIMSTAAFNTALSSDQKWKRTNKFKQEQSLGASLLSTQRETLIGIFLCLSALFLYVIQPFPGLLTMCLIGIAYKGFDYFAAPLVAIIAARSQTRS